MNEYRKNHERDYEESKKIANKTAKDLTKKVFPQGISEEDIVHTHYAGEEEYPFLEEKKVIEIYNKYFNNKNQ